MTHSSPFTSNQNKKNDKLKFNMLIIFISLTAWLMHVEASNFHEVTYVAECKTSDKHWWEIN